MFISYQRGSQTVPRWIRSHFYPRLQEILDDTVDYDVKIFFDEQISGGTSWPPTLRNALQRTRLLLPVCSPKYFSDPWCLAEWHSMAKREELIGWASPDQPQGLIYPVIFSDSDNFPKYAKERRMQNFRQWNLHYEQFRTSLDYLKFHKAVELVADELVPLIERAPVWQTDWPVRTPPPQPVNQTRLPRFGL